MAAAKTTVEIYTNSTGGVYGYGVGKVPVKVTEEDPWDPLSKVFKKYTHTIRHTGDSGDYDIVVYRSSGIEFRYKKPNERVQDVELYFKATDNPSDSNPLVVGFVSRNWREGNRSKGCPTIAGRGTGSKCYYTWSYLTTGGGINGFTGDINEENSISEKDLIHGLFYELGTRTTGGGGTGQNKVVSLGEQPTGNEGLQYPESAYFTKGEGKGDSDSSEEDEDVSSGTRQLTVIKDTDYNVPGFVGYEHKLGGDTVSELYVSYGRDSRYIKVDPSFHSEYNLLSSVTVFYETSGTAVGSDGFGVSRTSGSNRPVLIVFNLTSGKYEYSYYNFVSDLKTKPSVTKTITSRDAIDGGTSGIQPRLVQEKERLMPLIEFKGGSGSNENVTTKGPEPVSGQGTVNTGGYKFKKVTMKPVTQDPNVPGGKSVGPWVLYSSQLFTNEKGAKIGGGDRVISGITTDDVTNSSSNKYNSITVYYSTKTDSNDYGDYKALLVQFEKVTNRTGDIGVNITKTYIRRGNREGTKWAIANDISSRIGTGGDADTQLVPILQKENNKLKQIEFVTGTGSSSTGGHDNISISGPTRIDGHGIPGGHEFMKVTMTPNLGEGGPGERGVLGEESGKGSPEGPWRVYNDQLIDHELSMKIPEYDTDNVLADFLTDTSKSSKMYSSITVYYSPEGSGKYKALLVEFDDYGSETYIRRLNEGGTKWAKANAGEISARGSDMLPVLQKQREKMRPLIEFKQDGGKNNENIITHTQDVGKGVVGQERYRFQKVTMTANTSDTKGRGGSSSGPWKVYNSDQLFIYEKGMKIQDSKGPVSLLTGVYTKEVTDISSNKYSSISVYYAVTGSGSSSKYKALLVEFDQPGSCGRRKYIKRLDEKGKSWAIAYGDGINTSNTGITVQVLSEVAIDANIITGATVIIGGGDAYVSKVDEENPWDKLSKIFKKYTHTIQYPTGGDSRYEPSDHTIRVYYNGTGSNNKFTYKAPTVKVVQVEVFFKGDATVTTKEPLVVGFVYEEGSNSDSRCKSISKCYYTWSKLKGTRRYRYYLAGDWIKQQDLVTVLLEELGNTGGVSSRKNKLVLRLGVQSTDDVGGGTLQYPGSGYYSDKQVTVTKEPLTGRDTGLTGFEKYEHTVSRSVSADDFDGFYFSYENNSMYIVTGSWPEYLFLQSVTVYYDDGSGKGGGDGIRKPVLFVFHFKGTGVAYVYKYSEFIEDLKKVTPDKAVSIVSTVSNVTTAKIITGSGRLQAIRRDCRDGDSQFQSTLQEESKTLERLITFVQGGGGNEHITTVKHTVGQGQGMKFQKYTMKPNADDAKGGTSVGPWKVFSSQLFTNGKGGKVDEDATIQPANVLNDIYTTGTGSGQKYRSISVYYSPGGRALLIKFVKAGTSTGDKIYIKIEKERDADRKKWVKADDIGTVDAARLTQIAKAAGIISSISTVTAKVIQIETNRTEGTHSSGEGITVNVTEEKPWDKLSKVFKRYVHTTTYPGGGSGYKASEYTITVYGQGGSGFTLNEPKNKVKEVELFFKGTDNVGTDNPLILGYIYGSDTSSGIGSDGSNINGCSSSDSGCSSGKCYYTWKELTSRAQYDCTISHESISENDLITRLLEELGPRVKREKIFVINLNLKPTDRSSTKYPDSGQNKKNIIVKKESDVDGFDKYEHTFSEISGGVQELYVGYENNSRFFKTGLGSRGAKIDTVTAYFDTSTNKLVLITFNLKGVSGIYVYSYQDFVNDLKSNGSGTKTITKLDSISDGAGPGSELLSKLQGEIERLVQLIQFKEGSRSGGSSSNVNVTTTGPQEVKGRPSTASPGVGGITFQKVTMKPVTQDQGVPGGISVGPWIVYDDQLLGREPGAKIQDNNGVLTSIFTGRVTDSKSSKYSSISVYYAVTGKSTRDYKYTALFLEFVPGSGRGSSTETKTYIRRGNREGTKWVKADYINIGTGDDGDRSLLSLLKEEWEKLRPMIEFVKDDGRSGYENQNITTTGLQNVVDQGEGNETFKKVTMTPSTNDAKNGPWTVYSSKLIDGGSNEKIEPEDVLDGIYTSGDSNKYQSISVYYYVIGGSKALLVEFDPGGCGRRKYFKRTGKGGTQWAKTDRGDSIGSGGTVKAHELTRIAKAAGIIVDSEPGPTAPPGDGAECVSDNIASSRVEACGGGRGSGSSVHSEEASSNGSSRDGRAGGGEAASTNTSSDSSIPNASGPAGIATGVVGVGVGAGYAVYKNLGAVSGLIGRIAGK